MGSRFQSGISRGWKNGFSGDRRRSCRYLPMHVESQIGWWQDSVFVERPAELVDISLHGGRFRTQTKPPMVVGKSIWYRPVGVGNNEWIEGVLVSINKPFFGKCQLAINFRADFRYETFKAVVYGTHIEEASSRREVPEHETQQFWK